MCHQESVLTILVGQVPVDYHATHTQITLIDRVTQARLSFQRCATLHAAFQLPPSIVPLISVSDDDDEGVFVMLTADNSGGGSQYTARRRPQWV